jgi:hypothetical protein
MSPKWSVKRYGLSLKCPSKLKKAHSKHRGDSPLEIIGSNAGEEIRVGLEECESYLSQS